MGLKLYKGCARLTMQWVMTMTETLEKQLRREVSDTLRQLAPKSPLPPKSGIRTPAVEIAKLEFPQYDLGKLLIPQSFTVDEDTERSYLIGNAVGLMLLHHCNPDLRPLFQKTDSAAYSFWSHHAMTYAGLVSLLLKKDKHAANRHASHCREFLHDINPPSRESTPHVLAAHAVFVGIDYAAQSYLKHGPNKFGDALTLSSIHDVHARVVPNEEFSLFTARGWD